MVIICAVFQIEIQSQLALQDVSLLKHSPSWALSASVGYGESLFLEWINEIKNSYLMYDSRPVLGRVWLG